MNCTLDELTGATTKQEPRELYEKVLLPLL